MQFFVLMQEPIAKRQTARVDALKADGTIRGDAPRCEACGQCVGSRLWMPPYQVLGVRPSFKFFLAVLQCVCCYGAHGTASAAPVP